MKKILCPTDFSEASHNAIGYAAKFAQQCDSELVLFNIQSIFSLPPGELLKSDPPTVEKARNTVKAQALEVTTAFDVSCYGEVQVADDTLSSVIKNRGDEFDLIIMGTNGPDDLYQFFFGTNTYQVLRKSGIPLLFVPDTTRFSFIKRVVFAYDYLHLGVPPLDQFSSWMQHFDVDVKFLQLSKRPLTEDETVHLSRHKLEISYELEDEFNVSFEQLVSDDYSEAIQHFMLTSDSELLILCTHPYTLAEKLFHKSLAKRIAMDFMYPALIVHE